jgi:pyridoxal phosphate enzyme (YggS family)
MIETNLQEIRSRIDVAAQKAGRRAEDITLIAVSKFQEAGLVEEAIAAGQRDFGENRVQEAQSKWPTLLDRHPNIALHFLGALQSNKAADAVKLFDCIHSVDRPKIAKALAKEMQAQGLHRPCFIQVNTGEEPQKAGILPQDASDFIRHCRDELDLPVVGLMCVPPVDANAALHFAFLADLAGKHGLEKLSMGMTADFETAIEMGATHIRVGTAIFGARKAL